MEARKKCKRKDNARNFMFFFDNNNDNNNNMAIISEFQMIFIYVYIGYIYTSVLFLV